MIGIDIVDLEQAVKDSNWERPGFLKKLFSEAEQGLIARATQPQQMVWLLWTMKEAAYKIYSPKFDWHAFAPLQLLCRLDEIDSYGAKGMVSCRGEHYVTRTMACRDFIHTIAFSTAAKARVLIKAHDDPEKTYQKTKPASVSHHGRFLALAYMQSF